MNALKNLGSAVSIAAIGLSATAGSVNSNPLMGSAEGRVLTMQQASAVVGRGSTSQYYGYYASQYSYYAYLYSYYGYYFDVYGAEDTASELYYYAYQFGYTAYLFAYYAYANSTYGEYVNTITDALGL